MHTYQKYHKNLLLGFSGNAEAPTTLSLSLTRQVSIKLSVVKNKTKQTNKQANRVTLNLCWILFHICFLDTGIFSYPIPPSATTNPVTYFYLKCAVIKSVLPHSPLLRGRNLTINSCSQPELQERTPHCSLRGRSATFFLLYHFSTTG